MTLRLAHPSASPAQAREFCASIREIEVKLLREWTALGQKLAQLRAVEQAYARIALPPRRITLAEVRARDRKIEAEKLLAGASLTQLRALLAKAQKGVKA